MFNGSTSACFNSYIETFGLPRYVEEMVLSNHLPAHYKIHRPGHREPKQKNLGCLQNHGPQVKFTKVWQQPSRKSLAGISPEKPLQDWRLPNPADWGTSGQNDNNNSISFGVISITPFLTMLNTKPSMRLYTMIPYCLI